MQNALTTSDMVTVPVIRNIRESKNLCLDFDAVLTAGPSLREVNWGHPNHTVIEFDDVCDPMDNAPQMTHIEKIVDFSIASNSKRTLIHCHAGMCRSTASGIIFLLTHGVDAELAVSTLASIHPEERTFCPNPQMIKLASTFFDLPELSEIVDSHIYIPSR
jgi:predicted protein tyrosine phosphatase